MARDPDVAVARVFDPLARLRPLGEGRTACDDKERQAAAVTLSTGVGVHSTTGVGHHGAPHGCTSSPIPTSTTDTQKFLFWLMGTFVTLMWAS